MKVFIEWKFYSSYLPNIHTGQFVNLTSLTCLMHKFHSRDYLIFNLNGDFMRKILPCKGNGTHDLPTHVFLTLGYHWGSCHSVPNKISMTSQFIGKGRVLEHSKIKHGRAKSVSPASESTDTPTPFYLLQDSH